MFEAHAFSIQSTFQPAGNWYIQSFGNLFTIILTILMSVAGTMGIVFIIIAGIKFVTAGGDPKNVASARSTITYAIIGLAVAVLAFVIVQIVQTIFRANIPVT